MLICLITFAPFLSTIILERSNDVQFPRVNEEFIYRSTRLYVACLSFFRFTLAVTPLVDYALTPLHPFPKRYKIARARVDTIRRKVSHDLLLKGEISLELRKTNELRLRRGVILEVSTSHKGSVLFAIGKRCHTLPCCFRPSSSWREAGSKLKPPLPFLPVIGNRCTGRFSRPGPDP